MLGSPDNKQPMFATLKAMFPHIDLSVVNEELTFSENLQNIVAQLGTPRHSETVIEISHMKEAVDQQELKIQKSLVNEEDVLGNITNRTLKREKCEKQHRSMYAIEPIEEESSQCWHNEENMFGQARDPAAKKIDILGDPISDIWELGSENGKDWFHH